MVTLQRGRKPIASEPKIGPVVELTRSDLAHLAVKRDPVVIQNIRDNHHRIARAIAAGLSNAEIAEVCGVSISRVSTLRRDPSMRQLVAEKQSMLDSEFAASGDAVVDYLKSNALKAQAMLSDKLDEAAEKGEYLPTRDLLGIAELGLDRTGYGKVNKNLNVNVDFAARLEAARQRTDRAATLRIVGSSSPVPAASRSVGEPQPVAPQRDRPVPLPPILRRV